MRFLFDTNIVLDVLFQRIPFVHEAQQLWQAHDDGKIDGLISATSVTNIFYIARRYQDIERARRAVRLCLKTFRIVAVNAKLLREADAMSGSDYEDNVQIACAVAARRSRPVDAIVTRNASDFSDASIPILSPAEALQRIS